MIARVLVFIETGLIPMAFREVCESLDIDADQEYYTSVEINQIKEKAGKKSKVIEKIQDGYSTAECAELLGVSTPNFNGNYAHRVEKIRRGVYTRESVDKLVASKNNKKIDDLHIDVADNSEPVKNKTTDPFAKYRSKVKKVSVKSEQRIQRLSVSEDINGNAIISIYLENISPQEALQALVDIFN